MRVAIYARYSSDLQSQTSLDDQIRLCKARAEALGATQIEFYQDAAISGASTLTRPGFQDLMAKAAEGRFNVVVAEALDRLSRDQEDIAGIYKRLSFSGVRIITLTEGEINELHIGLKGTMNALYLKDLAQKTKRGLKGRVAAGKSAGGNSYGYEVVTRLAVNGTVERGDRTINQAEAAIVARIFEEYAAGRSPRSIAHDLNAEAIPGPRGGNWSSSTINGNRERGTGILNNELYIGKLVWNRLSYIKNPNTGKRVSRMNPPEDWIIEDVPHLRLVSDNQWHAVRNRQSTLRPTPKPKTERHAFWEEQRPKFLLSGLMTCGKCGSSYSKISKHLFGCSASRNKGLSVCDNRQNIRGDEIEAYILNALQSRLMAPELFEEFSRAFIAEINKTRSQASQNKKRLQQELAKAEKGIANIIQAIKDGIPAVTVKDELLALEAQKENLAKQLATAQDEQSLIHPNLATLYRKKVANLAEALNSDNRNWQAFDIIRSLIERVTLTPTGEELTITLKGDLAGILALCDAASPETQKPALPPEERAKQIKLVAGARCRAFRQPSAAGLAIMRWATGGGMCPTIFWGWRWCCPMGAFCKPAGGRLVRVTRSRGVTGRT